MMQGEAKTESADETKASEDQAGYLWGGWRYPYYGGYYPYYGGYYPYYGGYYGLYRYPYYGGYWW